MRPQKKRSRKPEAWREVVLTRHDWKDFWNVRSTHARGWLDVHYDYDDPIPFGWAFKSGSGSSIPRPLFEDVILTRIDNMRGKRSRNEEPRSEARKQLVKQNYQLLESANDATEENATSSAEALALRSFRARTQRRGVAEAKKLGTRHADRTRREPVHSWHAPRDPEGWPEGLAKPEEEE